MAFKASKKREKKEPVIAEGLQLGPNAGIRQAYELMMKQFIKQMAEEYRAEIEKIMDMSGTKKHFSADAKIPLKTISGVFERLKERWQKNAERFAEKAAMKSAMAINKHSFSTVKQSLEALGVAAPKNQETDRFADTIGLYVNQNIALIKSIPEQFHSRIERATWNSLTSPTGTEQGAYGLFNAIQDQMGKEFDRATLIARDQTAKLNSVLNDARMESAGVQTFEWVHSSAGKKPRQCHQEWNGRKFLVGGGPTELVEVLPDGSYEKYTPGKDGASKYDIGKPGHPINCRCRAKPVIIF